MHTKVTDCSQDFFLFLRSACVASGDLIQRNGGNNDTSPQVGIQEMQPQAGLDPCQSFDRCWQELVFCQERFGLGFQTNELQCSAVALLPSESPTWTNFPQKMKALAMARAPPFFLSTPPPVSFLTEPELCVLRTAPGKDIAQDHR